MPKRYYDAIDDGAPGEDDARYASATYNSLTGLPTHQLPSMHSHTNASQQQQMHGYATYAGQPFASGSGVGAGGASTSNSASGSALTPLSIPSLSVTPPANLNHHHHPLPPIPPSSTASTLSSLPSVSSSVPSTAAASTVASTSTAGLATQSHPHPHSQGTASNNNNNNNNINNSSVGIPPDAPPHSEMVEGEESYTYRVTPEIRETLFREVHGRQLNTMQPVYQLPADEDEIKRHEYFHKMMYIVMGDKNWVGPMEEVLSAPSDRKRRVLDIGCGSGIWAIQIADEFPEVEVVGCDLAPIQPDMVPPNCDFELFDAQLNPYPDEYFDVVHARSVHTGIRNYSLFLEEIGRILAPGGLVMLVESEVKALTEGKIPIDAGPRGGAPGWHAFWEQYRRCLAGNHIDTTVPTRLGALLRATGAFEEVVAQEATVPVGFWPKDENLLAVGEHAWMDHDRFIPGVRPLFLSYGLSEFRVKILVEDAQQDLYYPLTRPYSCVHVSHARKKVSWTPPRRRTRRLRR